MLFVGDDWAEDHHDIELVDEAGTILARRRLPEGQVGVTRLHALIANLGRSLLPVCSPAPAPSHHSPRAHVHLHEHEL